MSEPKVKIKAIQIELDQEISVTQECICTALEYFLNKIEKHAHLKNKLYAKIATFEEKEMEDKELKNDA
jgi:tRNA(Phe) wybutosine-synthesizing methylase Tyw3